MNPKGFVAAASTTSHTSTSRRSAICAISFTSAMLTERKVFSRSLTSSAASGEDTGTMVSMNRPYAASPAVRHSGVTPPMTLGVFHVFHSLLPGSTRSGEKQR